MYKELRNSGFQIIDKVYSLQEINKILKLLEAKTFQGQFGVREFLLKNSDITSLVFNPNLKKILSELLPNCTTSIKSVYFDKPPTANWNVSWHQDLTINLANRKEIDNYKNWRVKDERVVVQPDQELLENIITVRIHLDDCTEQNGALRVIERSHIIGTVEIKDWIKTKPGKERICEVNKGGILLMKPLILHSSRRTDNKNNRRVIHIEFTDQKLPKGLKWKEKVDFQCF